MGRDGIGGRGGGGGGGGLGGGSIGLQRQNNEIDNSFYRPVSRVADVRSSKKDDAINTEQTDTLLIIIIIMNICQRPRYQNIVTAQGAYRSNNSNNILQHQI